MKRQTWDIHQVKRVKVSEFTASLIGDNVSMTSMEENDHKEKISFVWLGRNIEHDKRIQASMDQLELVMPCALATDNYDEFERWMMTSSSDRSIFVVASDEFKTKVMQTRRSSSNILAIYLYELGRKSNTCYRAYPSECKRIQNINNLRETITNDLIHLERDRYLHEECAHEQRTSPGVGSFCAQQVTEDSNVDAKRDINNSQFVLIDINNRLNQPATAMLKALREMAKNSIVVHPDSASFDFTQLPNKPTFFFISSLVATRMKRKPKQTTAMFILDDDGKKIDHRERFENGEDLVFELADVIYRCYKEEANESSLSGDVRSAKIKEEQADRVYNVLKEAYKSAFETKLHMI